MNCLGRENEDGIKNSEWNLAQLECRLNFKDYPAALQP
jgi:hypothetical protein